ncbi:MAG: hypothetical protein KAJ78_08915 [Acidobacteria bacterium]|nr:hypothetical protein [Acidobacteriota bacterium]
MNKTRGENTENRNLGIMGRLFMMALVVTVVTTVGAPVAQAQLEDLKKPEPTVPQAFTLQGEFVRMAYNNEGFVTLGYRIANSSVAEEWMLLEMGVTLRNKVKEQKLTREDLTLVTPDGTHIPLASQVEFNKANLRALDKRATMVRDSINYFPVGVTRVNTMNFFADPSGKARTLAFDQVSLNFQFATVGRIYFHVPDGIEVGQHWLYVQFADSVVQVPFRVFTKAEEKEFRKMWKTLKKEHEAEMQ